MPFAFTPGAKEALHYTGSAAARRHLDGICPQLLLLAIVEHSALGSVAILSELGIHLPGLREETIKALPATTSAAHQTIDGLTLDKFAFHAIELAYIEARDLGENCIGTEHLLLGLIRGPGEVGRIFHERHILPEQVIGQIKKDRLTRSAPVLMAD